MRAGLVRSAIVIAVCLILTSLLVPALAAAQTKDLTEFQKETVASIREITLQLILIAVGVFALLGSFATAENRTFKARGLLWIAFALLGLSVICGLFAYGNLIWTLGKGIFDPFGAVAGLAKVQWGTFGLGGLLFALFVVLNIKRR